MLGGIRAHAAIASFSVVIAGLFGAFLWHISGNPARAIVDSVLRGTPTVVSADTDASDTTAYLTASDTLATPESLPAPPAESPAVTESAVAPAPSSTDPLMLSATTSSSSGSASEPATSSPVRSGVVTQASSSDEAVTVTSTNVVSGYTPTPITAPVATTTSAMDVCVAAKVGDNIEIRLESGALSTEEVATAIESCLLQIYPGIQDATTTTTTS